MADSPVVTGAPLIGVVSLQGGVSEHVAALQESGARTRLVRRPEELGGLDGIVVPGGE
ncbi:pyridoxal 5'-phosphate synthase glutaminase subunit PdxT, partial [Propionibacterium freudenreichii]|nr:pyridoxal 5'-phosphate synthase glutaminase subunit PdxT [Propionibacterium freudenreichii]